MTRINQQETRAGIIRQATTSPQTSLKHARSVNINCGAAVLKFRLGEDCHEINIHEVVYTTSEFEPIVNGQPLDTLYRTEWFLSSDAGFVRIELNHELLLPIANHCLSDSPWNYRIWAEDTDSQRFEDYKLVFELPKFQSRLPSIYDFECMVDPATATDFNPYRIFAGVAISTLLGIDWREYVEVTIHREGQPPFVIHDVYSVGLYPLK